MIGRIFLGSFLVLGLATSPLQAAGPSIGIFTGIYGSVSVTHAGTGMPQPVRVKDTVQFQDLIETQAASSMRALLDDDTLLSLAEDSRLQVTEHLYDPEAGKRSAVLQLVRGAVRALVTKMPGTGSRFEIHTHSAIAAARGTYFVVWVNAEGGTGIANIGDEGDVAFTAAGQEVVVRPGHYSVTLKAGPPVPPVVIPPQGRPAEAIRVTEVRQNIAAQTPRQIVESIGGVVEPKLPQARFWSNTGGTPQEGSPNSSPTSSMMTGVTGASGSSATPPAVISGAAGLLGLGIAGSAPGNAGRGSLLGLGLGGSMNPGYGSGYSSGYSNSGPGSMNSGPGSMNSGPGSGYKSGSNSGKN